MVDASGDVVDLLDRHADVVRHLLGGALHAVAEADGLDLGRSIDGRGDHRHRVDVVQEGDIGTQLGHVATHVQEDRDGAQRAHDPADAERVGDGLAQTVLLRNLEVDHGAGFVAGDLEHRDGVVRAIERGATVERRLDGRMDAQRLSDAAGDDLRGAQPLRVDVMQRDG